MALAATGPEAAPRAEVAAGRSRRWIRPLLFLLALTAMAVAAPVLGLGKHLAELRGWIESLGAWGPVVFALIYAIATVAAAPASLLTIAAGAMFGSVVGVATVVVGATLGAAAAFAIARWLARDAVAGWLAKSDRFAKLDAMTERHGAIIVAITRLLPIFPFSLLNYGFGLTRVRFRTYLLWSFVCIIPGTALYVVGADAVTQGLAEGRVPWGLVGALAGVLVVLFFVIRHARRVLAAREAG
ncbi:MAG: VTT domain-containing protein, partial [Thermoanaerobaculia bacterium]